MTSAAVLFYGRRSRTSRSFDDLGFGSLAPSPFSSSSSSSSTSMDSNICYNHRHRHHHNRRRGVLHRRHRHISFDDPDNSHHPSNALHPSARLSLPIGEVLERMCIGINNIGARVWKWNSVDWVLINEFGMRVPEVSQASLTSPSLGVYFSA